MFGQSLLSGAFGSALDPGLYFNNKLYTGNGTAQSIGGKIKGASEINGSGSYITLPNFASDVLQNNFSWSFWVKPSNITNKELGGSYTYTSGTGCGWSIGFWSSLRLGWVTQSNTWNTISNSTTLSTGTWYHIVVTKNTTSANIYVNGSDSNTTSASGDFSIKTTGTNAADIENDFWYGAVDSQGMTYNMSGELDQSRFYTGILSASNITALYNETADTASTLDFPAGAGCTAAYTFDANANVVGFPTTADVSTCNFPTTATNLFQFDDNVNDTCGNNNGTAVNAAYGTGIFGKAYDFSANGTGTVATGTSSYITFADDMSRANNFSWSFWIKSTGTPSNYPTLVSFYGAYVNYIYFSPNIATMYLAFSDGADTTFSTGLTSLSDWTHFAFTKSSTSGRKFYINGTSVFSDNTTADAGAAPRTGNAIGMHWASQGDWRYPLNGDTLIDQFRLFPSALTSSQVTQLVRGGEYNGTNNNVTYPGFLNLQPDLTWIKRTSSVEPHALYDSLRGPNKQLSTDSTASQATNSAQYPGLTSFGPYGFSIGNNGGVNSASQSYVSWNWKAGGTAVTNNDGSVASQVSANQDAGFSISTFTTTSGNFSTGHGLSKAPELIIAKLYDYTYGWETIYPDTFGQAAGSSNPSDWNRMFLNTDAAPTSNGYMAADATKIYNGAFGSPYPSFVYYAWHSVPKYSKIGSYNGNGNATGPIISTGFEPAWIIIKALASGESWIMFDAARNTSNPRNCQLRANDTMDQACNTDQLDFNADNFQLKTSWAGINASGTTYIYMTFAVPLTT